MDSIRYDSFTYYVEKAIELGRLFHNSIGIILDKTNENDKIQHLNIDLEPEPIPVREFIGKGYTINDIKYILKDEYWSYLSNVKFYIKQLSKGSFGLADEIFDIYKIEFDVKNNKDDKGAHFEMQYEKIPNKK